MGQPPLIGHLPVPREYWPLDGGLTVDGKRDSNANPSSKRIQTSSIVDTDLCGGQFTLSTQWISLNFGFLIHPSSHSYPTSLNSPSVSNVQKHLSHLALS